MINKFPNFQNKKLKMNDLDKNNSNFKRFKKNL